MIRNQIIDPESSPPPKGNANYSFDYQAGNASNMNNYHSRSNEEPWFNSNGRESPMYTYNNYGQTDQNQYSNAFAGVPDPIEDDLENEPPLLDELGIRFDHIYSKTQAVINIRQEISEHLLDDTDLAGPLVFCLLLGACLLLRGKVQFGYIYGFSVFGCLGMHTLISLLHSGAATVDFWMTCSVLGYCMLPIVALAAVAIVLNLQSLLGLIFAGCVIAWSTYGATRLFHAKLGLQEQYWLVAYPCMLMYSCFVLITVF